MKRYLSLLIVTAAALFSLSACSRGEPEATGLTDHLESHIAASAPPASSAPPDESVATQANDQGGNILVAYYSWADNAVSTEGVDTLSSPSVVTPGNVQQLAGWIQDETGGDLFSIQVAEPYPSDWDSCLDRAHEERGNQARPALVENVAGLDQYDTVFLGYPNWWYGVPMALLTFLEQNDLSGKNVYLFCSHGTGGLANSVRLITEAAPNATISDDIFDCYEEEAASSEEAVRAWVNGLGYSQPTPAKDEPEASAAATAGVLLEVLPVKDTHSLL